jgi:lysophospholipase L1-like esterase
MHMKKFAMRLALVTIVMVTGSVGLLSTTAQARPDSAPPGASRATGWYVALGDSLAAGYQPGAGDDKAGGYVGLVLDAKQDASPKTKLLNLACSGETSTTLVNGGRCSYEEGSQLNEAIEFLKAHQNTTRLVTVTIGANDVTPCLTAPDRNACVQQRLTALAGNLQQVLSKAHAAAPDADILVTNYYNPYLALYFVDPALAQITTGLQAALNNTIAAVTAPYGSTVDVATAFQSIDTTMVNGVPTNVGVICRLTWMCSRNDIHANDAGYELIGETVAAALP